MKSILKKYFLVICTLLFLHACAGADRQYIVGGEPTDGSGSGSLPPDAGGGISNEGCKVTLNSVFTLQIKLNPTDDPANTDETGLSKTDPRDLPPIILHFSGNTVTMYGDEFQVAEFPLGSYTIQLRQKAGTKATGTYDEQGNINLNGVVFEMLSPKAATFPSFTLTTGNTGDVSGAAGSISSIGSPISADDKSVTLVGGFTVADLTDPYNGKALILKIAGNVDKIPNPKDCVGGGGGGVSLKLVTKDKSNNDVETPLAADGTLVMGSVFIPEQGTSDNPDALPFKKTAVLRVQNNSTSAVTAQFNNTNEFKYSPSSIEVAPDKSKDVTITFSSPSKAYTPNDPPLTGSGVSQSVSIGDKTLKVSGLLKRASPELTLDLGDSTTPGVIDLGFDPVKISGSGNSSKIGCSSTYQPNVLGRTVKVINTGVRPLKIQSIPEPVMDDKNDNNVDPFCSSFGAKFHRMALGAEGSASCVKFNQYGHEFIKDDCTLPPFTAKSLEEVKDFVRFKVVYFPKNAKSIITNAKDTAKLTMLTDDPVYNAANPLSIALQAGLSKDTSDLIGLSRVSDGKTSSFRIGNKQRVNLDIPKGADHYTQIFAIKNGGSDVLTNVKLSFSDNLDKNQFKICKAIINSIDESSCAYANADVINQVPAMLQTEGEAYFALRYDKPLSDTTTKPAKQYLTISYVPSGTPGAVNKFEVGVGGTRGYGVLSGNVQMKVEFLGSFVASPPLKGKATDSVDFRDPKFNTVKSGSLRMNFTKADEEGNLMYVTVFNDKSWEDPNFKIQNIKSAEERRKFIRLPSDNVMACGDTHTACKNDPNNKNSVLQNCIEGNDIDKDYEPNHCAYFYYVLKNTEKPQGTGSEENGGVIPGIYNNETGELTLPNLILHVMNPYHGGTFAGNGYDATKANSDNYKTDTTLKATFTTSLLSSYQVNGVNYVPAGQDKIPHLSIGSDDLEKFDKCADGWDPTIDFNPQDPTASPTPTFTCYVAPRTSPSSPGFLRGMPAVPANNGERSIVLAMVTRFNDQTGSSEYIPFFMNDSMMWIAFQGRLKQCKDDWSDCPEAPMH